MRLPIAIVVVLGLALWAPTAAAQNTVRRRIVRLPSHSLENSTDVGRLQRGRPVTGSLLRGERRLIRFGVVAVRGRFPDILLTLTVTNPHGDADIYCTPWALSRRANALPGPAFNLWRSTHSQDLDTLYLSAKSNDFQDGVVELEVQIANGTNVTMDVAAFACSVYGASATETEFSLEMDTTLDPHELIDREKAAMESIYDKCCADGNCGPWLRHTGNSTEKIEHESGDEIELDFCHRMGSVCTREGRLKRLGMRGYNLSCEFPLEEIMTLESLQKLDMDRNRLTGDIGEILAGLGTLKNLTHISLPENELTGTLTSPPEACDLFDGQVHFVNLQVNEINGRIPSCILSNPELREFHIARNDLFGEIPDVIPEGTKLEALTVAANRIGGGIPDSIANAKFLRFVFFGQNRLSGPIPDALGMLPRMESMDLHRNGFDAFPDAWKDPNWNPPKTLKQLSVAENEIKDEFPASLGRAEKLEVFSIADNQVFGKLVVKEGWFANVFVFNASFNNLEGPIPEEVSGMALFKPVGFGPFPRFDIRSNDMSGEIPKLFYVSTTPSIVIGGIHLEDNNFTCSSPEELLYIFELECKPDPVLVEQEKALRLSSEANQEANEVSTREKDSSNKASVKAIVPAVVGGVLGAMILAGLIAVIIIRRKKKEQMSQVDYTQNVEIGATGDTKEEHDGKSMLGAGFVSSG